ncbi:MAG: hypothetical protein AVDCRST_MAG07-1317, partial [uncultured Frankineae bacterium]
DRSPGTLQPHPPTLVPRRHRDGRRPDDAVVPARPGTADLPPLRRGLGLDRPGRRPALRRVRGRRRRAAGEVGQDPAAARGARGAPLRAVARRRRAAPAHRRRRPAAPAPPGLPGAGPRGRPVRAPHEPQHGCLAAAVLRPVDGLPGRGRGRRAAGRSLGRPGRGAARAGLGPRGRPLPLGPARARQHLQRRHQLAAAGVELAVPRATPRRRGVRQQRGLVRRQAARHLPARPPLHGHDAGGAVPQHGRRRRPGAAGRARL